MCENSELVVLIQRITEKTEAFASDKLIVLEPELDDCILVGKLIKSIFLNIQLGDDWTDQELVVFYGEQAIVITTFVQRIMPLLGQQGILWTICAYTKFISNGVPSELCDTVFARIMKLFNLMDSECKMNLLKGVITSWAELRCGGANSICLNRGQRCRFSGVRNVETFDMQDLPIVVTEAGESAFMQCLLYFVKKGIAELKSLPHYQGMLWMCLIRECDDILLVSKLLTIMNLVIKEQLVDPFSFLNYTDVVLSHYKFFIENPEAVNDFLKRSIDRKLAECMKIICAIVEKMPATHLKDIGLTSFLPFAIDVAVMINKRPVPYCAVFLRFVNSYIVLLNNSKIDSSLFKDFARKCVDLIKIMIMKTAKIDNKYIENIFTFFQKIEGPEKTTIVVVNILKDIERGESARMAYGLKKVIANLGNDIITNAVNKLLNVLKLITSDDTGVEVWRTFLELIDKTTLQDYLSQVLISVAGLHGKAGFEDIFKILFKARSECSNKTITCKKFDRAVFVFFNHDRDFMRQFPLQGFEKSHLLKKCIEMLLEEGPEAQKHVLERIYDEIENDGTDFELLAKLIHALMYAIRISTCEDSRQLIGICLGKLGAIDPGRLGMAAVGDNSKHIDRRHTSTLKLITNQIGFYEHVLTICSKILTDCNDAEKSNYVGYAVQMVLREINTPELKRVRLGALQALKFDIFREIEPYKESNIVVSMSQKPDFHVKPFVSVSKTYSEWLWKWFFSASSNIKDPLLLKVFKSLQFVYHAEDHRLPQQMLPQLVIQSLVEMNAQVKDEALNEICSVFEAALSCNDGWIRLACHTCFQIVELVEKFFISLDESKGYRYWAPIKIFLANVIGKKIDETNLLSVAVAMKYNSSCRALRWLEQYGIEMDGDSLWFERDLMYLLERIYFQLSDTDGVLGSFETIKLNTFPLPKEQVIALEATGDYTRALPLYQSPHLQKVPLVKCFMRMNQPFAAYNNAKAMIQDEQGYVLNKLQDYQIEGAYKTGDWKFLSEKMKNIEQININSWGTHVAAILSQIHEKSIDSFETCMWRAREQLMNSLEAVTMEDADTYSQAYRYIQRLHILYEIKDASEQFGFFEDGSITNFSQFLLDKWKIRSDNVIQCSGVLEPIYEVRRNLLKLATGHENKEAICGYLLESCRLSRQAGHLETAWTHLVEARNLNIANVLQIDIETARYEFQRGEQYTAISTLKRSLKKHFPDLMDKMDTPAKKVESLNKSYLESKDIRTVSLSYKEKEEFVDATLVLTDFLGRASGANVSEIYRMYKFIYELDKHDTIELLAYRFAVFYDKCYYTREIKKSFDSAEFAMRLYAKVLNTGKRYMLHVMPRLLTIWQDFAALEDNITAERKFLEGSKRKSTAKDEKVPTKKLADLMRVIFEKAGDYMFFTAFPQLVSNICHDSELTFEVIQHMIVQLIIEYPHECLWQIIASARSEDYVRSERTKKIFAAVHKQAPNMDFNDLVKQYDFMAAQLIAVAENSKIKPGTQKDFNKVFPKFTEFFKRYPQCRVSVPFITMVEKRMPTFLASQFVIPDQAANAIFITGFEDEFVTFSSLEKPKKITMIGSNAARYTLIAKKNDELRKDARCLDFCRTVNTLLLRDPEARRRQLHIRTYCVIPLQGRGGIIEWVPNLIHLRQAATSKSGVPARASDWANVKADMKARRKYFNKLCSENPVAMADYLRDHFPDPCKWYGARLAFTRTAATMSMIGFILGLGDRHCENILLDSTNGEICHVDFNVLFNMGEDLPIPEKVPFRLTRNIVDGFGPTGVEGCYRKSCEVIMKLLREEQEMLCTVLQTFIHDPLLEWNKIEKRNQQMRQNKTNPNVDGENVKSRTEIDLIRSRLEGNIVTRKYYPLTKSVVPMSVEGQVAQLIKMATDTTTLADMFIGWSPYL